MDKVKELAKLIRNERRSLGLNGESQRDLLRKIRASFDVTNDELAAALDVNPNTVLAYLAPESNAKHRKMPEADKVVLARVLRNRPKASKRS